MTDSHPLIESTDQITTNRSKFWNFCHECASTSEAELQTDKSSYYGKFIGVVAETSVATSFAVAWDWYIHNKFCNFLYDCGCTWIWDGGWDDCNVHRTDGGPKCPWCTATDATAWTTTYIAQFLMLATFVYLLRYRDSCIYTLNKRLLGGRTEATDDVDVDIENKRTYNDNTLPTSRIWADRLVRVLLAPTLIYFITGFIVGFLFFIFNPHYHVFIWH
jgi:hypothetical protein